MPRLLTVKEIGLGLTKLHGWRSRRGFLTKVFEFENFPAGIAFVDQVSKVAEKQEHHPDIKIRYTTVELALQTHSEGGVTRWDFELAEAIDRIRPASLKLG